MTSNTGAPRHQKPTHSHAGHDAHVAELEKIAAAGRGRVDIIPQAIAIPAVLALCGALCIYAAVTNTAVGWAYLVGAALLVPGILSLLIRRKPLFALTEEGVRVQDVLLPWDHIEDYVVTDNGYNGFTMHTNVGLIHAAGYTPPKLTLFRMVGQTIRKRKEGRYETHLGLWVGAKGMNGEKLAKRIDEFFSAARARAELVRLRAG